MGLFAPGRRHAFLGQPGHDGQGSAGLATDRVIRWFQLQPSMHVAINTGRPKSMREMTLRSLNALGSMHRVEFDETLVFMNRTGLPEDPGPRSRRCAGSVRPGTASWPWSITSPH
jgi:hypothetical protein